MVKFPCYIQILKISIGVQYLRHQKGSECSSWSEAVAAAVWSNEGNGNRLHFHFVILLS